MSAAEVIEEIKRLSPEAQREVKHFVQELETSKSAVNYASDEEFKRATDLVFRRYNSLLKKLAQ